MRNITLIFLLCMSFCFSFSLASATSLGQTNQITDYGITWNFGSNVQYGQYISGDYWVVGPVEITSVTPDGEPGHHGVEINTTSTNTQPYDDRLNTYNSGTLIEFPYTAQPGDSVLKTVSIDTSLPTCRPCLKEASILTVVSTVPPEDSFRPNYASNQKKYYRWSDIDLSLLPQVDVANLTYPKYSGSTDTPDYSQTGNEIVSLEDTAGYFKRPWIDHFSNYIGRAIHPDDHMPDYGGDMYKQTGTALLRTMMSDPLEEKKETLIGLLQYGIDLEGFMVNNGTKFVGNGGHTGGRKMVLTFAGVLFGDTQMKDFVKNSDQDHFSESDHNYFSPTADGGNGKVLLGDETTNVTSESSYWDLLETGNGFRTHADPYGYIDGGYRGGDHYLIPINAPFWKSDVMAMILMPELKPIYNDDELEKVTYRYVNQGRWTQPDPCAPFDGNPANRGITYGPDGNGGCIPDTNPDDGVGRYPEMHGIDADGGAYARYRVPIADALWNKYITKGDVIIDLSTGNGNSDEPAVPPADESKFSKFGIIPVISYGQSVSAGSNDHRSPIVDSEIKNKYQKYVLMLNSEKTDFVPLNYVQPEKHDEGMLEVTVEQFLDNHSDAPKFLSLNSGVGGKTIHYLSVRPEYIFESNETIENITNIVPTGYAFAVLNTEGKYDIYRDNGSVNPAQAGSGNRPSAYGNILENIQSAKQIAEQNGDELSDLVMFNWTQGQASIGTLRTNYQANLQQLISMLEDDLSHIYGKSVQVVSMVNQMNQYNKDVGKGQLHTIFDNEDVHFGSPEYSRQTKYPQTTGEGSKPGPHLNNLGYRIMGEQMGYQLYDILTKGYSNLPHITAYQVTPSENAITLVFGGLRGKLIYDDSIYTQEYTESQKVVNYIDDIPSYWTKGVPENYGFESGSESAVIKNVQILGSDTIKVEFESLPSEAFNLSLGYFFKYGLVSTAIRDSVQHDLQTQTENWGDTSIHKVQHYPMVQVIHVIPSDSAQKQLVIKQNKKPYLEITPVIVEPEVNISVIEETSSGGNGRPRTIDICPEGDYTRSRYDKKCGEKPKVSIIGDDIESADQKSEESVIAIEKGDYIPPLEKENITLEKSAKSIGKDNKKNPRNLSRVNYIQKKDYKQNCETVSKLQEDDEILMKKVRSFYKFKDESSSSKRLQIRKLESLGIVQGYSDRTFRPHNEVTRAEFLKILLKSHCYDYSSVDTSTLKYVDIDANIWQARAIAKAEELGLVKGDIDQKGNPIFRPNDTITKVEALKIVLRVSEIEVQELLMTNYSDIDTDWHEKYIRTGESLGLYDAFIDNQKFGANTAVKREDMVDLIERFVQLYE